jgi:hypothetical protein
MRKFRRSAFDKLNISVVIVRQIFHSSQTSLGGDRSIFEVMTPDTDRSTSYLDLYLEIDNEGRLRMKLYDK